MCLHGIASRWQGHTVVNEEQINRLLGSGILGVAPSSPNDPVNPEATARRGVQCHHGRHGHSQPGGKLQKPPAIRSECWTLSSFVTMPWLLAETAKVPPRTHGP